MTFNRDTLLRLIICIDFVFVSIVLMAEWLPKSYHLNQLTILVLGLWGIVQRDSLIQIELLMLIKFFSIILDTIAIGMYFQIGKQSYTAINHSMYFSISAFFAVFLLILKPIMLLLLNKVRQERLNNPTFGAWGSASEYTPVDGQ